MENNISKSAKLVTRATQILAATIAALLLLAQPLQAQMRGLDIRIGAHTAEPTNGLGNGYDNGFGLYTRIGAPMGVGRLSLMGAATWTRFKPKSSLFDDLDIITLQFGPHLMMIPVVSFGIPNLEATLSYISSLSGP